MESMIAAIARRVTDGHPLSDEDARAIFESHDLIAIGMMADEVRRRVHGPRTTFVRVFEVHCQAPPAALPANLSAGEIRIVGVPVSADAAVDAVEKTATLASGVPLTGFSLADLQALAPGGKELQELCVRLRRAGLEAVAEVPVDRVDAAGGAIVAAREGGLAVERLTVQDMDTGSRIAMLTRARDLQAASGGFVALAPLPRNVAVTAPSTGYDDVKQVALARLLVGEVRSIQLDWALYGPKLAQVALTMGADDVDGIIADDPGTLGPRRRAIEEIRGNIRAAGLEPVERDARWNERTVSGETTRA